MIGERELVHERMRSSPRKSVLDDSVVSGSGLFDHEMVINVRLSNAKVIFNQHHLFKDNLPPHFSRIFFSHIKLLLEQTIKAKSEHLFNQALKNERLIVESED